MDFLQGNVDSCVTVVHVVVWDRREALARQTLRVGTPQGHVNSEQASGDERRAKKVAFMSTNGFSYQALCETMTAGQERVVCLGDLSDLRG